MITLLNTIVDYFLNIDKSLFFFINKTLGYPFLDLIMRTLSSEVMWIYVGGMYILYAILKRKWYILIFIAYLLLIIGIADYFVSQFIKPWVGRLRPCREFLDMVRIVNNCAGIYSFPSNHALNSFIIVVMLGNFLKDKALQKIFLIIAITVCISRVYIGVHYPSDVVAGALLGALWGYWMYNLFNFFTNLFNKRL